MKRAAVVVLVVVVLLTGLPLVMGMGMGSGCSDCGPALLLLCGALAVVLAGVAFTNAADPRRLKRRVAAPASTLIATLLERPPRWA